jgi:hypothetical protein
MRRLDLLITQARRDTENVEFTDTTGIPDEDFIQYFNDAQFRIQSLILNKNAKVFNKEKEITTVANQESYDIPYDCFMGNRLESVEFSATGNVNNYYPLKQGHLHERVAGLSGVPSFYIRLDGKIMLQPRPDSSSNKIRLIYQKKLPRLDMRRGKVSAVTLSGSSISSLTLDTSELLDRDALLEEGFCSIVDKNGNLKMTRIPVEDVSESTGAVTVEAGFTFDSDETIAVGDYIVRGNLSSTHSFLNEICERYLYSYVSWKILKRDSNTDSSEAQVELSSLEQDILESYAEPDNDVDYIPILDPQYLDQDIY